MPTKEYVVTVYKKDWLESLYSHMTSLGCKLVLKRPDSRNTHYLLTEKQVNNLRQNPNIWAVEAVDSFQVRRLELEKEPYVIGGQFWKKGNPVGGISPGFTQWGLLHCAGDDAQRRQFGEWGDPSPTEVISDTVELYDQGRNVDVVIVDDPVSFDNEEWYSPSTLQSRFVQYQWFNELNSLVSTIDDDGQTLPSGTITYHDGASLALYHGNHVTGTACGQYYGWAREANIYNIALTDTWLSGQKIQSLLVWDYLRAFHRNKPINPDTGKRNPTVTNHSYGGVIQFETPLTLADVGLVSWRGVTYNASNPPPGGWTEASLTSNFGIRFGSVELPGYNSAIVADVQDAIAEGIVVVGAAGNDNMYMAEEGDQDWDNIVQYFGVNRWQSRGAYPNTPDSGSIVVGAMQDNNRFNRSTYTQHGPGVDVFAPGDAILSVYGNTGFNDTKYTQGSGNFYSAISGTSMASPQVCGILAIAAGGGQETYNQGDAKTYVDTVSRYNDMVFNDSGSGVSVYEQIGLETYTSTHRAPILFTQALDDTTGGGNQPSWLQDYYDAIRVIPGNAATTLTTCAVGGHNAFTSDPTLQTAIRNFVGGSNPAGAINNARFTITPFDGYTYTIDGTSYPIMGSLYVPTGLSASTIDAVVVFHGTLSSGTIGQAAEDMLDRFVVTTVTNLNIRDKIVFAAAYPQDHISQSDQYNLSGVGTEQADFLMGDNLPYARAAIEWVKNDLNSFISFQGGTKQVGDVYLFGHSQGGKLVSKINTIDTGLAGVIANAPGPIQFDQTCSADPGNTSCSKVSAIHGPVGAAGSGGHDDFTADMGAPNKFILARPIRPTSGYVMRQKGARPGVGVNIGRSDFNEGIAFPRPRVRFGKRPGPAPKTFPINVTNSGASHYVFNGDDRLVTHTDALDPVISIRSGDTLEFTLNASGHPFYIKKSATTGTNNQVTTGTVTGQGTSIGTVTWDTSGVTPGTYYYICQFHSGMQGQIVVS